MHLCNGSFRVFDLFVQDVGCAAIHIDCKVSCKTANEITDFVLTDWIQRKFDFFDGTVAAEDLTQVAFVHVFRELLNHNLYPISNVFNVRLNRGNRPAV
jgi:hypothetical protein